MNKAKIKKKAVLAINKIIILLLVIFVVILVIWFWVKLDIPGKLNILIPGFNSFRTGNADDNNQQIPTYNLCKIISCSPFGECKENGGGDEIWIENIRCPNNLKCFVKESANIQENGDLKIVMFETRIGEIVKDLLSAPNSVNFISKYGDINRLSFGVTHSKEFCYVLRTNREVLSQTGEIWRSWSPDNPWRYSWKQDKKDRFIELLAWDINNKEQYVSKRIKIIPPPS